MITQVNISSATSWDFDAALADAALFVFAGSAVAVAAILAVRAGFAGVYVDLS